MEKHENIFLKKSFVVIVGASRGLGRSIALQFGAKFPPNTVLVLMARNVEANSKAARDMFFRVLATEEPSIRILTYAPGGVDTDMLRNVETNSSSTSLRTFVHDLRQDDKLWTPEEAVTDLVHVLEDNTFDNAVYVDNYQQKVLSYLDDM